MSTRGCSRAWQAEAIEDGRLDEADRASFERHAATCATCRGEVASLRKLREVMAALPDTSLTELERRRARLALLRKADEHTVGRGARRPLWLVPAAALAVAGLAAAAVGAGRLSSRQDAPVAALEPPRAEVASVEKAEFSQETSGTSTRVTLRSGVASFHVHKLPPGSRYVVTLPDGELEVRGTRFTVEVRERETRKVVVTEGLVSLRLSAYNGSVAAGESWQAPALAAEAPSAQPPASPSPPPPAPPPPASSSPASSPSSPAASSPPPQPPSSSPTVATSQGAATAAPIQTAAAQPPLPQPPSAQPSAPSGQPDNGAPAPSSSAEAPRPPSAGARFAEAMSAFGAGDYGRADRLFAAFIADFPRDGRAEDAMYLRAEGRSRSGDKAGAAALARAYLATFPRGLRRREAERLAGLTPSP